MNLIRCRKGLAVALMAVIIAMLGCEKVEYKERQIRLDDSVKRYNAAVRWGYYQAAAGFLNNRDGSVPRVDEEYLKKIRVTDYEVGQGQHLSADFTETIVDVSFSYYHTESASIKSIVDRQLWWYDPDTERWFLEGEFPDFAGGLRRKRR